MKTGRPSSYNPKTAAEICDKLSAGNSLRSILEGDEKMPELKVVMRWLGRFPDFRDQYSRARELWADSEFDRMMVIADSPIEGEKSEEGVDSKGQSFSKTMRGDMIEHRRLQVDTRKWALARMFPKKYGDRQAIEHSGPDGKPLLPLEELLASYAKATKEKE